MRPQSIGTGPRTRDEEFLAKSKGVVSPESGDPIGKSPRRVAALEENGEDVCWFSPQLL